MDDPAFVLHALRTRFCPIAGPPHLGNLVVLVNEQGTPVHAAVQIADDLVFTKNGIGDTHPWLFMKLDALVGLYTALAGKVRVVYVGEPVASTQTLNRPSGLEPRAD